MDVTSDNAFQKSVFSVVDNFDVSKLNNTFWQQNAARPLFSHLKSMQRRLALPILKELLQSGETSEPPDESVGEGGGEEDGEKAAGKGKGSEATVKGKGQKRKRAATQQTKGLEKNGEDDTTLASEEMSAAEIARSVKSFSWRETLNALQILVPTGSARWHELDSQHDSYKESTEINAKTVLFMCTECAHGMLFRSRAIGCLHFHLKHTGATSSSDAKTVSDNDAIVAVHDLAHPIATFRLDLLVEDDIRRSLSVEQPAASSSSASTEAAIDFHRKLSDPLNTLLLNDMRWFIDALTSPPISRELPLYNSRNLAPMFSLQSTDVLRNAFDRKAFVEHFGKIYEEERRQAIDRDSALEITPFGEVEKSLRFKDVECADVKRLLAACAYRSGRLVPKLNLQFSELRKNTSFVRVLPTEQLRQALTLLPQTDARPAKRRKATALQMEKKEKRKNASALFQAAICQAVASTDIAERAAGKKRESTKLESAKFNFIIFKILRF